MGRNYSKVCVLNDISTLNKSMHDTSRSDNPGNNTDRAIILNKNPQKIDLLWNKVKIAIYSLKHYSTKNILDENNDSIKTSIYACTIKEIHARKTFLHLLFSFLYWFKPIWDLLISFSLFFELVFSPYQDSHNDIGNDTFWFIIFETIIDCVFFIDAFYDIRFDLKNMPIALKAFEHPFEISSGKKIKFIIQMISCIPYQFFDFRLRYLKILRIVNLKRMNSIQKCMELVLIRSARYQTIILAMIKLLRIVIFFGLVANIAASYWMMIAENETINSWMTDFSTNYFEVPTNFDYYIESLFFISYTLSSVGYGSYSSVISDENENIYKMIIMATGGIIYALINMSMKYVIIKFTISDMLMNHNKDEIILFLMTLNKNNEYLFPNKLWNDIKMLLFQNADSKSDDIFRNNKFFTKLTFLHQFEILKRTYSKFLENFSEYFIGVSDYFLYEFLIQLDPKICQPNQILLRLGVKPECVYYIMDDPVLVIDKNRKTIGYMKDGHVVGDKLIIYDQKSVYSYKICPDHPIFCFALEKSEMEYLISKFPSDIGKIKLNITRIFHKKGEFIKLKKTVNAIRDPIMNAKEIDPKIRKDSSDIDNDKDVNKLQESIFCLIEKPSSYNDLHKDIDKSYIYINNSDYDRGYFNDKYNRSCSEMNNDKCFSEMKFSKVNESLNNLESCKHELMEAFEDPELDSKNNNLLYQPQQMNDLRLSIVELKQNFMDKEISNPLQKINKGIGKISQSVNFENRMRTDPTKFKAPKELAKIDDEPDIDQILNENQFEVKDIPFEITEIEHTESELDIDYHNSKFKKDEFLNLSFDIPCEAVDLDRTEWSLDNQIENMTAKLLLLKKRFTQIKEKHEKEIQILLKLILIEIKKYQTTSSKKLGLATTSIKDFRRFKKLMV